MGLNMIALLEMAASAGAGGVGGYVDGRFPDKRVAGLPPSAIGGVLLGAVGAFVLKGRAAQFATAAAIGPLAGNAYRYGSEKGAAAASSVSGVGYSPSLRRYAMGVGANGGALGAGRRPMSAADMQASLALLRSMSV